MLTPSAWPPGVLPSGISSSASSPVTATAPDGIPSDIASSLPVRSSRKPGRDSQRYRQLLAGPVFPQAENGQPWQHRTGLHAQGTPPASPAPCPDRSDTLAEHGSRLAEALSEVQQAQHACRMPPPRIGHVSAAAGYDNVSRTHGLNRR